MNPKRSTPRHIIIKMIKGKDKERILKVAKTKQKAKKTLHIQEKLHKAISKFFSRNLAGEGSGMTYSKG